MNAIAYERYGSPDELHFVRVPRPSLKPGQVLVRVEARSLNAVDRRMLRADPFLVRLANGLVRPRGRILGADVAIDDGHVRGKIVLDARAFSGANPVGSSTSVQRSGPSQS